MILRCHPFMLGLTDVYYLGILSLQGCFWVFRPTCTLCPGSSAQASWTPLQELLRPLFLQGFSCQFTVLIFP